MHTLRAQWFSCHPNLRMENGIASTVKRITSFFTRDVSHALVCQQEKGGSPIHIHNEQSSQQYSSSRYRENTRITINNCRKMLRRGEKKKLANPIHVMCGVDDDLVKWRDVITNIFRVECEHGVCVCVDWSNLHPPTIQWRVLCTVL